MENETKTGASRADDPIEPATLGPSAAEGKATGARAIAAKTTATKTIDASEPSGLPGSPVPLAPGPAKADPGESGLKTHGGLPVAEPFQSFSAPLPKERNGVFSQLVTDDGDIAGLVAYSIYKQNKLDWLSAFEAAKGRAPSEDELASYIIGEGTPRRIATYRHLAEATLAGNGPKPSASRAAPHAGQRRGGSMLGDNTAMVLTYAIIALVFLIGLLVTAHYTMSSR